MTGRIMDLDLAREGVDGTRFYAPPLQAALIQSGAALGQLWREYPRETSDVLSAIVWAAVFAYFLSEALKPSKPQACA